MTMIPTLNAAGQVTLPPEANAAAQAQEVEEFNVLISKSRAITLRPK
jgi:hypothetical protein